MKSWLGENSMYFYSTNFFIASIMVCIFWQLQSMDEPAHNMLPLKLALMIRPDCFNRQMIFCLSRLSKSCEKIIRATVLYRMPYNADYRAWVLSSDAETRKQHFMGLEPELKKLPDLIWNRFGTTCAQASFGSELNWSLYHSIRPKRLLSRENEVMLERRSFFNSDYVGNCAVWENFYDVLPHKPVVSFDKNGDIYVHACGTIETQNSFGVEVLEYRLSSEQGVSAFICMAEIDGESVQLAIFLEFPRLLEAFLKASETKFSVGFVRKAFVLEGVVLPENYDESKPYYKEARHYTSFEDLPKRIRKAIVAHYLAQKGESKKKRWACFGV
jgi:hypothetical protein